MEGLLAIIGTVLLVLGIVGGLASFEGWYWLIVLAIVFYIISARFTDRSG